MKRAVLVVFAFLLAAAPAHAAGRKTVRAQKGSIRAELSYPRPVFTNEWSNGRLRIWNGKREIVDRKVSYGTDFGRQLAVVQVDGTGLPEVVLNLYSGGSCGCVTTWIYTGAKRVKAPWIAPPTMRDSDGDGKPEIHGYWGFGASWASRADYRLPVRVWIYANGRVSDVTRSFPAEVQADQADNFAEYQKRLKDDNIGGAWDALSAYVADGYTLGQGDAAMAVVQAAVASGKLDIEDGMSGTEVLAQLRDLLRQAGYVTAAPAAPAAPEDDDDDDYAFAAAAGREKVVRAQLGTVRAELRHPVGVEWANGRLRIWNGKRLVVDRKIAFGADEDRSPISVVQLDGTGLPEVVFTVFSGGSCVCSTTWIYTGKQRARAPWFWPPTIRDADGDGKPEFHGFGSFGGSWSFRADYRYVAAVWTYANGAVHDVTRSFPAEIQADQAAQFAEYQRRLAAGNVGGARNALAAYAGDGYMLGQGDAAMAVVQAAADAGELDVEPSMFTETLSGQAFVDELRELLRKAGYNASAAHAAAAGKRHVIRSQLGSVRAELSYVAVSAYSWRDPRLRIWNGTRLVVNRSVPIFAPLNSGQPIAVRQLDGSGLPEVLFTGYFGGTSCCFYNWIYAGARRIRAPWYIPPTLRDADGDGKPEFHGVGDPVGSWGALSGFPRPAKVWTYANGALHDVTRAFPAEVQADQADFYAGFQRSLSGGEIGGARDALSGYVADGYTLGQGDAAMAVLVAAVNAGQLEDPKSEFSGAEYLEQVRVGLRRTGYVPNAAHAAAAGKRHVIRSHQGSVRAELSYEQTLPSYWDHSRLRIWDGKRLLVNRPVGVYAPLYGTSPIAVRQLDGVGKPEVVLTEFTGGHGCCFTAWIYAGAKRIRAPWLESAVLRDADGDGKPEFHAHQEKWSLWGARACGQSPVRVWAYADGALHDVTRSFPAEVQADQASQYSNFQENVKSSEGCARDAMAAYVGDGYALGQGDAGMAVAQAAADAGQLDDDGLDSSGADFLNELRDVLRKAGYTT